MGRKPCCTKEEGLNRGTWTAAEDKILKDYIQLHGEGKWRTLPKKAGLRRCGKSCRLRWLNYLRPDIKRGNITHDEEELIIRLHKLLGNRWSLIAGRLPGRTDNEIKNYWNINICKKLQEQQNPSSSIRKPSSVFQERPKFVSGKSIAQPSKARADSFPFRTKAIKCRKVFISTPEPQTYDNKNQVLDTKQVKVASPSTANGLVDDGHQNVKGSESLPELNLEDNDPSDFMRDFEIDEYLLSFLNTDFSQPQNFDDTIGGNSWTTNTCDKGYSSPNSDETPLFSEDNQLHCVDFPSMDSLIGSEFEKLRD